MQSWEYPEGKSVRQFTSHSRYQGYRSYRNAEDHNVLGICCLLFLLLMVVSSLQQ